MNLNISTFNELVETLKLVYRKHYLGDNCIGWKELSDKLYNAICNAIGDNEFCEWIEELKKEREKDQKFYDNRKYWD